MSESEVRDIVGASAQDVLVEAALEEYEREIDFFYLSQLVPLNVNIFILEKISVFPFDLFTSPQGTVFFRQVISNFFDVSLLIITRLASDTGADLRTLTRFKNWCLSQVRSEYRDSLRAQLRSVKFDSEVKSLLKAATGMRNTRVAHLTRDDVGVVDSLRRLNLVELKRLCVSLNILLDMLSFSVDMKKLPIGYLETIGGAPNKSDIEEILDLIVLNDPAFNLPEKEPVYWPYHRERLSTVQLEKFNEYRVKLGRNPV